MNIYYEKQDSGNDFQEFYIQQMQTSEIEISFYLCFWTWCLYVCHLWYIFFQ